MFLNDTLDDYFLILISVMYSSLRDLVHFASKTKCLKIFYVFSQNLDDVSILDRVIPSVSYFLSDNDPIIRLSSLHVLIHLVRFHLAS